MVVQEIGYGDESVRKSAAEPAGKPWSMSTTTTWWTSSCCGSATTRANLWTPGRHHAGARGEQHRLVPTPKSGRDGSMEPSDISDAAVTAGLAQTSSIGAAPDWTGTLLASAKAARSRR